MIREMKAKQVGLLQSPFLWFLLTLAAIAGLTAVGPAEKALGFNVRVVYLHGAWVWTALAAFLLAALLGLAGLLTRREALHRWSKALGRTGLLFWITYLPLSIWAMQTNWNGLFLAEPRWRMGVIFAIGGLVLQAGLVLIDEPTWASAGNIAYLLAIGLALQRAQQVMHPSSPIMESGSGRIQLFFGGLVLLCLLAAWQITRGWLHVDSSRMRKPAA
jgi:hypothetical protein